MLTDQIYREPLESFTDREQIVALFEQFLHTARPGKLRLLAIRGNSGTGKTFLISYLTDHVCPELNWQSGQISFAKSIPDFRFILTGVESALSNKNCVPLHSLTQYRSKRDEYNRSFDEYRTSITIHQAIAASGQSSVSNVQQNIQVNVELHKRELQLRSELTRALTELAEESQAPLCLFIDGYERLIEAAPELDGWLWEEVVFGMVRASSHPLVVMTCGWETPRGATIKPFSHDAELTDFDLVHVRSYLEKLDVLPTPSDLPPAEVQELINTFHKLTRGHPLMLSLAATYLLEFAPHERTAKSLQTNRALVDERAQIQFLDDRLLSRLPEPHRTLLEWGPILRRHIDQATLQVLLAVSIEGSDAQQAKLDDRTYIRFLQYPFINRTSVSSNGSLRSTPTFHDLVRRIRLEELRHHPQTRERLHRAMADYYQGIAAVEEQRRSGTDGEAFADDAQWVTLAAGKEFEARLEWLYHSLQIELLQESSFVTWQKSVARAVDDWQRTRAKSLVELAQQLEAEREPCFDQTGKFYSPYLYWYARYLILETRWEEAQVVLETAVEVCKQTGDQTSAEGCFFYLGVVCHQRGILDRAFFYYEQSLVTAMGLGDIPGTLAAFTSIANVCRDMGRLKEALDYAKTALSCSEMLKDASMMIQSLNSLGLIYSQLGEFKQAFDSHQRALALLENEDNVSLKATLLTNMGLAHKEQGEFEQALSYYKQALPLREQVGDPAGVANCLNNIGFIYFEWNDFEQALDCFERALALRERVDNPTDIATSLQNTGAIYQIQEGRSEDALNNYMRALEIRKQVGNPANIAMSLMVLGGFFQMQGNIEEALSYYEQALVLRKQLDNPIEIAVVFNILGHMYQKQDDFPRALNYFQQALISLEQASDLAERLPTLHNLEGLCSQYGEVERAVSYYEQELVICEQLGDTRRVMELLDKMGDLYRQQGDFEQVLDCYERALPLMERVLRPMDLARYLDKIGEVYRDLKEPGQALYYFERVLPMIEQEADTGLTINYLFKIGNVYGQRGKEEQALSYYMRSADFCLQTGLDRLAQGQWEQAMHYFQSTLDLKEKIGDPAGIVLILELIASLHLMGNDFEEGVQYFERALRVKERVGDVKGMAESLIHIASAYNKQRKLKEAFDHYQEALVLFEQLDEPAQRATVFHKLGDLSDSLGQSEHALSYYHKALALREQLDNPADLAITLHDLGYIYKKRGEFEKSISSYQGALKLREHLDVPEDLALTLNNMGTLYSSLNEPDLALDYYQRALEIREKIGDPDLITSTLINIGMAYYSKRSFQQALYHFERTLALYEQVEDPISVAQSIAQVLNVIGVLHIQLGDLSQAASSLERSLSIREQGEKENPAQIAESLHNLGNVYYKQQAWYQAIETLSRALSTFEKMGHGFEEQVVKDLTWLAECYSQVGETEKVQIYQERAERLRRTHQSDENI